MERQLCAISSHYLYCKINERCWGSDGLNLVQNNGEIAGQTVNHFHLHLIPRYEGDGLNLNWPQQEISAEQLEEIRQSIKKSI